MPIFLFHFAFAQNYWTPIYAFHGPITLSPHRACRRADTQFVCPRLTFRPICMTLQENEIDDVLDGGVLES